MSSQPFAPVTTPKIERANRLLSLRVHPGFGDLLRIINEMIEENDKVCAEYPGWDPQVITVLKVRMQEAREIRTALQNRINIAIQEGIEEQATQPNLHAKTAAEILETGDLVRQQVLTKFEEMDGEARAAGSY